MLELRVLSVDGDRATAICRQLLSAQFSLEAGVERLRRIRTPMLPRPSAAKRAKAGSEMGVPTKLNPRPLASIRLSDDLAPVVDAR